MIIGFESLFFPTFNICNYILSSCFSCLKCCFNNLGEWFFIFNKPHVVPDSIDFRMIGGLHIFVDKYPSPLCNNPYLIYFKPASAHPVDPAGGCNAAFSECFTPFCNINPGSKFRSVNSAGPDKSTCINFSSVVKNNFSV